MPKTSIEIFTAEKNLKQKFDYVERVAELKRKGLGYREIAIALSIPKETVMQYYHLWVQEHKEDLFESKMAIMVETNQMYPKIIADAEEQYQRAKLSGKSVDMAGWLRVKLDALREYRDYLKSIGFLNETISQQYEQQSSTEAVDPILDIINANKKKLLEEIKKGEDSGKTNAENTV